MKLFSSDGSLAVVAVGEAPIGIFAIGQVARGVIAIGQLGVGVIVLGQGVVSVIGLGQGGIGVMWFSGMLGLGGRGFCFRLIPGMDPPRVAPQETQFQSLFSGEFPDGFVRAQFLATPRGTMLAQHGQPLPIKTTPSVAMALATASNDGKIRELFAHLTVHTTATARTLVCDQLVEIPGARPTYGIGFQIFRVAMLIAIAVLWWWAFLAPGMPGGT
jgi:hypothetical protein